MDKADIPSYIYKKTFTCPVCKNEFEDYIIRPSKLKYVSSDIDLKATYVDVEPLFYDIIFCNYCGYASNNMFFNKITPRGVKFMLEKITPIFKPRNYSATRTLKDAVERYKMAMIVAMIIDAPASQIGYICMKLAWLYRIGGDSEKEMEFLQKTIAKFNQAYAKEDFPLCGLDELTFCYMLAAFYKLTQKPEQGIKWLSSIFAARTVNPRLKNRAFELKREIQKDIQAYEAEAKKV